MDLKRGSHSCIGSWWRVTQIPVLCASVDSPLTRISTTLPCMYSYLCHESINSKIMKFCTCVLTKFMYRALSHSQTVRISIVRVLIVTLPSGFPVWLLIIRLYVDFHRLPRHNPIPSSTGIHGVTVVLFQLRMHLS